MGGGIEFGETAQAALEREFQEEMGAQLKNIQHLTMIENIFIFNGMPGHQIVVVFQADFVDEAIYFREEIVCDENDVPFIAKWVEVGEFITGGKRLYPEGMVRFI